MNAILGATLVIAYFNSVNRMVLALGVESYEKKIKGYISKLCSYPNFCPSNRMFTFSFLQILPSGFQLYDSGHHDSFGT
jgi:hypothetical protein